MSAEDFTEMVEEVGGIFAVWLLRQACETNVEMGVPRQLGSQAVLGQTGLLDNSSYQEQASCGEALHCLGPPQRLPECRRALYEEAAAQALPAQPVEFYKNDSSPRGIVVIFNYIFKKNTDKLRKGARKDDENLRNVFTALGYNVWPKFFDLTKQETLDKLDELRNSSDLVYVDSLITIFLSHGGSFEDGFLTSDEETISVNEILYTKFTDQKCPLMKDKPKLFIFNYCREQVTPSNPVKYVRWNPNTDQLEAPSDVAVIQATLPHFKAGRYVDTGTIFVSEFCKVLEQNSNSLELIDLVFEISKKMKKDSQGNTPTVWPIHFGKFKFT